MFKNILFLIIVLLSVSFAQQNQDTLKIQLNFSEELKTSHVWDPNNYTLIDTITGNKIEVLFVGITTDRKTVVLFIKNPKKQSVLKITMRNIADLSGNLIETENNIKYINIPYTY